MRLCANLAAPMGQALNMILAKVRDSPSRQSDISSVAMEVSYFLNMAQPPMPVPPAPAAAPPAPSASMPPVYAMAPSLPPVVAPPAFAVAPTLPPGAGGYTAGAGAIRRPRKRTTGWCYDCGLREHWACDGACPPLDIFGYPVVRNSNKFLQLPPQHAAQAAGAPGARA